EYRATHPEADPCVAVSVCSVKGIVGHPLEEDIEQENAYPRGDEPEAHPFDDMARYRSKGQKGESNDRDGGSLKDFRTGENGLQFRIAIRRDVAHRIERDERLPKPVDPFQQQLREA